MRKFTLGLITIVFNYQAVAYDNSVALTGYVNHLCSQTIEVTPDTYGPSYDLFKVRLSGTDNRVASALPVARDGQTQIQLGVLAADGSVENFYINRFDFKSILLIDDSVWFLGDDFLKEYSLIQKEIIGTYPTLAQPVAIDLATRARGFAYDGQGLIYIAHGILGVATFDIRTRTPQNEIRTGLEQSSIAGGVVFKGNRLFVLYGAFHPEGFNGIAIVDLATGATNSVAYPRSAGVVDPYSSNLQVTDRHLFINNGGWIHVYDLAQLTASSTPLAPTWMVFVETLQTAAGARDHYLMVNGDLLVTGKDVIACSSVGFVPSGQHRPIKQWRMIHRQI